MAGALSAISRPTITAITREKRSRAEFLNVSGKERHHHGETGEADERRSNDRDLVRRQWSTPR